jgi:hypothetical protein
MAVHTPSACLTSIDTELKQTEALPGMSWIRSRTKSGHSHPSDDKINPNSSNASTSTLTTDRPASRRLEDHSRYPTYSRKIVSFAPNDSDNPYNWPRRKKLYVFFAGILAVMNSTIQSSLPSGAIDFIAQDFGVTKTIQLPLPISCFLAGYCVGPTLCGPLSENNGRQRVILAFFCVSTLSSMACAVAPNWPSLLFFRFICGVGFSGPIAITGGLYADIYNDPRARGMAMAWFMVSIGLGACYCRAGPLLWNKHNF